MLGRGNLYLVMATIVACQSAAPSKQQGTNGSGGGPATFGAGGAESTASTLDASGSSPVGGGASNATAPNGTGAAGTSGTSPTPARITLSKAAARYGGIRGTQLFVSVDGQATVGELASIEVTTLDANGNPLLFFDTDWNGSTDSATGRIVPPKLPTTQTFSLETALDGTLSLIGLAQLRLALYDRQGAHSDPIDVTIQPQTVVEKGGACDPKFVTNRCREGLACAGNPSICAAGTAPTIVNAAFQRNSEGPFIRLSGADPDQDVIIVRVDFLTSSDTPIMLDLDNDNALDADHLEVTHSIVNQDGGYQFAIESAVGFESQVPRVGLTAIDSTGLKSPTQRVSVSNQVTRNAGQSCDLAGFVGCVAGTQCLPATSGTPTCTTFAQAESLRCGVAPVWDLAKDPAKITGLISGYSNWEPPPGCLSAIAANRPEAVVKLHIAKSVPKLVLSTAVPETTIDTGIYVLPSCSASSDTALGCNDDTTGFSSLIALTNLAAGDYFVIVESLMEGGGSFGLSASTE